MAYNEILANRIRECLAEITEADEKEMMGGLVFMVKEKMCVGVVKNEMMCRIDPDIYDELLEKEGCRNMDFTKRPMKCYVFVDETGMRDKAEMKYWIDLAVDFNERAKSSKKKK